MDWFKVHEHGMGGERRRRGRGRAETRWKENREAWKKRMVRRHEVEGGIQDKGIKNEGGGL